MDKLTGLNSSSPFAALSVGRQSVVKEISPEEIAQSKKISDQAAVKVKISPEGKEISEAEADSSKSLWETRYGFKNGTTILANGRKRVVSIKGFDIEVLEYEGDKLTSKMKGDASGENAFTKVEHYDESGALVQSVDTTLEGVRDRSSKRTLASLHRNVTWYKDGEVTRKMQEGMVLSSASHLLMAGKVSAPNAKSLEDMVSGVTGEKHSFSYSASMFEYTRGALTRTATLSYSGQSEQKTNRNHEKIDGMAPKSTDGKNLTSNISAMIIDYDEDGNMVRRASFSEGRYTREKNRLGAEAKFMEQNSSVSWFSKGELVKKSEGSVTVEETKNQKLPQESLNLILSLGFTSREYAADKPHSAGEMLSHESMPSGVNPSPLDKQGMGVFPMNVYNPGEKPVKGGPYEIKTSNEIYRKGELVARQEDEEKAVENRLPLENQFRPGGSLTESDIPAYIQSSRHVDESYEEGVLKAHANLSMHEAITKDENGVVSVETVQSGSHGVSLDRKNVARVVSASLEDADQELGKASAAWERQMDLTIGGMRDILGL